VQTILIKIGHFCKVRNSGGYMFGNLKLGTKIGLGYGVIGLILAGSILATLWQVRHTEETVNRLVDLRTPTAQLSLVLLNGINQSASALRSWIILGDNVFREERTASWDTQIIPSLDTLKELSAHWTDPDGIGHFKAIISMTEQIDKDQKEVEDIAHTLDNTPATKILLEDGTPLIEILTASIGKMIVIEQSLEATADRKMLLGIMADVRGTAGLGAAAIRAYLISGDEKFKKEFEELWQKNTERFKDLSANDGLLTPEQKKLLNTFAQARDKLSPLPAKIFEIRGGEEWNLAHTWLAKKVVPAGNTIKNHLEAMIAIQKKLVQEDQEKLKLQTRLLKTAEWILLIAGITLCSLLAFFITRGITCPLSEAVEVAERLARGDLTMVFEPETTDETGQLLAAMKLMVGNLREVIKNLVQTVGTLSAASESLSSVSSQMASSAEETNIQAGIVAAASAQVSENVSMVASAAEQSSASISDVAAMTEEMSSIFENMVMFSKKTSENVRNMALSSDEISAGIYNSSSAVEEMTVSLNEVAKHTNQAHRVSQNADSRACEVSLKMEALASASKQIGKIVGVIKDIADQTNMLALNATIEAAGAGDAGRGFAVVAGEIKELAKQSANATDEIAEQVGHIQKSTDEAVGAIGDISKIIAELAGINQSIAASAEEQTATANEISKTISSNAVSVKNVAEKANESAILVEEIAKSTNETSKTAREAARQIDEVTKGVKDVAESSGEASVGVEEISENIRGISMASKETAEGAARTNMASKELAKTAEVLSGLVKRFRL
jgi:methyl-accepting chemotaxis protein